MEDNHLNASSFSERRELHSTAHKIKCVFNSFFVKRAEILEEEAFRSMLTLERRRTERSRKPCVLMLLDASGRVDGGLADCLFARMISVLLKCTRETDLVGWYQKGLILGALFTEISPVFRDSITEILHAKVVNALSNELTHVGTSNLVITVHLFPTNRDRDGGDPVVDARLLSRSFGERIKQAAASNREASD